VKPLLLIVIVVACQKPDDLPALREEAHATVAYYDAQLDQLETRKQAIVRSGLKIDRVLPGGDEVGSMMLTTSNGMIELRKRLTDAAAQLATANTADDLRSRTDRYRELAEDGLGSGTDHIAVPSVAAIGAALTIAESWVAHAQVEMAASGSGSAIMHP
jgi:hypothetical protein